MRTLQIVLFVIGLTAFLAAIFFIGADMGQTLWRTGVAALLADIVCLMLWPSPRRGDAA
jgi:hypothetical protein